LRACAWVESTLVNERNEIQMWKGDKFKLFILGEQEGSWVLRREPTMLCLRKTIIGLCLCWNCGMCSYKNGMCSCGAFSCWGNGSRALRRLFWEILENMIFHEVLGCDIIIQLNALKHWREVGRHEGLCVK